MLGAVVTLAGLAVPLVLASRTGEFRSEGRVAYCHPLRGEGYAVGVEFLETKGRWVVESTN